MGGFRNSRRAFKLKVRDIRRGMSARYGGVDGDAGNDDSGGRASFRRIGKFTVRESQRATVPRRGPRAKRSFGPGSRGRLRINNGLKVINGVLDVRINFTMQTEPQPSGEPPLGGAVARSFYRSRNRRNVPRTVVTAARLTAKSPLSATHPRPDSNTTHAPGTGEHCSRGGETAPRIRLAKLSCGSKRRDRTEDGSSPFRDS